MIKDNNNRMFCTSSVNIRDKLPINKVFDLDNILKNHALINPIGVNKMLK